MFGKNNRNLYWHYKNNSCICWYLFALFISFLLQGGIVIALLSTVVLYYAIRKNQKELNTCETTRKFREACNKEFKTVRNEKACQKY